MAKNNINDDIFAGFLTGEASNLALDYIENWDPRLPNTTTYIYLNALGLYSDVFDPETFREMLSDVKQQREKNQHRHKVLREKIKTIVMKYKDHVHSNYPDVRYGWNLLRQIYEICPFIYKDLDDQYYKYKRIIGEEKGPIDLEWHRENDELWRKKKVHQAAVENHINLINLEELLDPNDKCRVKQMHWCGMFAFYILRKAGMKCGYNWESMKWGEDGKPYLYGIPLDLFMNRKDRHYVKGYSENETPKLGDICVQTTDTMHHFIMLDDEVKNKNGRVHMVNSMNGNNVAQGIVEKQQDLRLDSRTLKSGQVRPFKDYFYDVSLL